MWFQRSSDLLSAADERIELISANYPQICNGQVGSLNYLRGFDNLVLMRLA